MAPDLEDSVIEAAFSAGANEGGGVYAFPGLAPLSMFLK